MKPRMCNPYLERCNVIPFTRNPPAPGYPRHKHSIWKGRVKGEMKCVERQEKQQTGRGRGSEISIRPPEQGFILQGYMSRKNGLGAPSTSDLPLQLGRSTATPDVFRSFSRK